jgi:SAM-dependent MidA family methyltransferase
MHVKFYAVHDETRPDKWQVMAWHDEREFLLASGLTRKAALAHIQLAERTALFCGAVVIA